MKKSNLLIVSLTALLSLCACGDSKDKVQFEEMASTCLVSEKVKTYVDAMKEQEKGLAYPFRISALNGPEDFMKQTQQMALLMLQKKLVVLTFVLF